MNHTTVKTKNVVRAINMLENLRSTAVGQESMGLIHGDPGLGKTTAVTYLTNQTNAVFLRARVSWTVRSMLRSLCRELELEPGHVSDEMIEQVSRAFLERGFPMSPLIIDEADYLLRQIDMLDALRDIYDTVGMPVILVMMKEAPRKIRSVSRLSRFKRRITEWVEFKPVSREDVRMAATQMAEVEVEDDLVKRIHDQTSGNMGRVVIALATVERFAKTNDLETVGLAEYGDRSLDQAA